MSTEASKRIDLLMRVTGTSNAQLARALSFDASYISRIRSGKRGLPTKLPFIEPAAEFFARNVREGYQADVLTREMGVSGDWPNDREAVARIIADWIQGTGTTNAKQAHANESSLSSAPGRSAAAQLFFGSAGRQEAALAFLGKAAGEEPCELMLQSDEDTAWMYEDPSFAGEWARRMAELAKAGRTITVVHTVSRDGNEMWEGVREWLPLYLYGAIRPYYYPRLRDGVRMRSLFVAKGRCALVSNSVMGMRGDVLSVLIDDAEAVAALEREFNAYLALCHPLADVLFPASSDDLDELVDDFQGNSVVVALVSDVLVCAQPDVGAIVVALSERSVVYRVGESRLVDAIYGYIERLPEKATGADAIRQMLCDCFAKRMIK